MDGVAESMAGSVTGSVGRETHWSWLGKVPYEQALRLQLAAREALVRGEGPERLLLLEHPHVYTLGRNASEDDLLLDAGERAARGIEVAATDRGGQVTYHGPGQLVAYLLSDLRRARFGVREMVRRIEAAVITWLASCGIAATGNVSAPGIYVQRNGTEAKIGSLGLKVRNGCTYHGVAVNIDMDLSPFDDIDPCGFPGLAVTDVKAFGVARTVDEAGNELAPLLAAQLARSGRA